MKRPYLALATMALVAGLTPGQVPRAWAYGLFDSAPVNPTRFAILARPVADDDWTLVVLEQLRSRPFCWTPRPDGLVDPTLNRFDYTGICGRFIDSNGYSLRLGDVDLNHAYRLRLQRSGGELQLLASTASQGGELLVGRGRVPRRDRDLFVSLQLEPGWELQRRLFGGRVLNHVYFANRQPLDALMAANRGRAVEPSPAQGEGGLAGPPLIPPPLETSPTWARRPSSRIESNAPARLNDTAADGPAPAVVTLQVIPYAERSTADGRSLPSRDTETAAQGL